MRKLEAEVLAAKKHPIPPGGADDASVRLVCLALILAMVALTIRIVSVW